MADFTERSRIEYVIFDVDGLLIDSESVYSEVTNQLLAPYGKSLTWEIRAALMGRPARESAVYLLSCFPDLPPSFTVEYYLEARRKLQDERWPFVTPLPGAIKLVQHLHNHGIPIALATGSQRRNFELKSAHLGELFNCFEGRVVCGDDGLFPHGRGKPYPDIFLVAAEKFLNFNVGEGKIDEEKVTREQRMARSKGLVFEDGMPGVQAGKRAGMNVVWVPDDNLLSLTAEWTSNREQPDLTLTSLEQFVPERWGLPAYESSSIPKSLQ